MQIIVNNLLISYERYGSGKAVLLLHGWGDTNKGWSGLVTKLSANYQIIAVDLPGFGGSEAPRQAWGLEEYAHMVAGFISKLELKPYAVVGHSNGGAIAIKAVGGGLVMPERLVLLGSAGIRNQGTGRKRALRYMAKATKVVIRPLPLNVRTKLRRNAYKAIGSDMFVAEHLQETFRKVVGGDVQADAARITVPTLLVYGENDAATPPVYGRLFHEVIDGSSLEVIGKAGHFVHHDQPGTVEKLIEEFLC